MFMPWLLEQEDREDEVGSLYYVVMKDYNNGCLGSVRDIHTVLDHFLKVHPKRFPMVREWLIAALKAYEDPLAK